MTEGKRAIVIPGYLLGEVGKLKPGRGTFVENGKIYADVLGVVNKNRGYVNVIPLKGRYDPVEGDFVIGTVIEAMPSCWLVDINAVYPALLHVNEVPWEIEFGDTGKYLNTGDVVMAKVLQVDQEKHVQLTLKDRNLYKVKGGYVINVESCKVPRIIGKKGSMINLLKRYTNSRIIVGQNGVIWLDGEEKNIRKVIEAIKLIQKESLSYGLTDKIEKLLKKDVQPI